MEFRQAHTEWGHVCVPRRDLGACLSCRNRQAQLMRFRAVITLSRPSGDVKPGQRRAQQARSTEYALRIHSPHDPRSVCLYCGRHILKTSNATNALSGLPKCGPRWCGRSLSRISSSSSYLPLHLMNLVIWMVGCRPGDLGYHARVFVLANAGMSHVESPWSKSWRCWEQSWDIQKQWVPV